MSKIPTLNIGLQQKKYYKFEECLEQNQYEQYQFYVSKVVKNKDQSYFEFYNMEDPQTLFIYLFSIRKQIETFEELLKSNPGSNSISEKLNYLRNQLTFNECLLPFKDRKMYYDIDIPRFECSFEKAEEIKDDLITSLKIKLDIRDFSKEIMVFTAHREDKFSYHIILPMNVIQIEISHSLTKQKWANYIRDYHMECITDMNEEYKKYVDNSIYSSFQNFRMLGQIKYGYNNPFIYTKWNYKGKIIIPEVPLIDCRDYSKREQMIHLNYFIQSCIGDMRNLREAKIIKLKPNQEQLEEGEKISFESLELEEDPRNIFRSLYPALSDKLKDGEITNQTYNFINSGGYMCPQCERTHEHQNPYLYIKNNITEYEIWFHCRRTENHKMISNYDKKINLITKEKKTFEYITEPKFHSTYSEKYCLPIHPEKNSIYFLSAGLGKGKTKVFIDFMKTKIQETPDVKILILSPRQIFASSLHHRLILEGLKFTCYLELKPHQYDTQTRFIVQMESLQYISSDYDIIIIDEVESCLAQFESTETMKSNLKGCADVFQRLLQKASYVICCDAFLTTKSTNVISKISDKKKFICKNTSPLVKRKAVEYENIESLIETLFQDLNIGKKIFFVSASREKLEQLERLILKTLPFMKYKIYHSNSKEKIRNVNEDWKDVQLVMVSPSVTVGVNYDLEDFDLLYMYGVSVSCCVRDLFQSSMRVRHLRDNIMKFCICKSFLSKNKDENLYSLKKIAEQLREGKELYKSFHKDYISQYQQQSLKDNLICDRWQELNDWLFLNKVYTVREQNLSRNFYKQVFYYYLGFCNYEYDMDNQVNIKTEILLNEFTKIIRYKEIKEIEDNTEAMKVSKILQSGEKNFELYLSLLKYKFNTSYQINIIREEKIDDLFNDYVNPRTRKRFYNVKREKYKLNVIDKSDLMRNVFLENSDKSAMRTLKIKEINDILGLKDSCERKIYSIEETNDIIEKIYPKYDQYCRIFNVKQQKLMNGIPIEKEKREKVKYVLDQIFFKWNGSGLSIKTIRIMRNKERYYEYWFEKTICGYIQEEQNFVLVTLLSTLIKA
jgi:hypothetical protein